MADQPQVVPSKDQIIARYRRLTSEINEVQVKVFDIETKAEEHDLVAGALEPLPAERKCFRLIGGVLVERTVGQVLPVVKQQSENLRSAVESHKELLERKQKELAQFMTDYKIQVKGASDDTQQQSSDAKGLLVS